MPTALRLSQILALIFTTSTAFGQSAETFRDRRAQQLWDRDPSTYVSERRYQNPWTSIRDTNILWVKRLWVTVEKGAKGNELLNNAVTAPNDLVVEGVRKGKYKAYQDERFTKQLSIETITDYDAGHISKYKIKEEWLYVESDHRLESRIIGIAPIKQVVQPDGSTTEETMFWVYFPDARNYLAEQKIAGNTDPSLRNIDQLLDTHHYTGTIDKISTRVRTNIMRVEGPQKLLIWAEWKHSEGK